MIPYSIYLRGTLCASTSSSTFLSRTFILGFLKIKGTILGVLIIRIIVFGGLYWGPLVWGNYQICLRTVFPYSPGDLRRSLESCGNLQTPSPCPYIWGFPKIRGYFFGGPHNKCYSILGSILGSPYLGKLPHNPIIVVSMFFSMIPI